MFLETRQVGHDRANMTKLWQHESGLVLEPVRVALPVIRVDLDGVRTKGDIESLVQELVVEDLTQLFSNDRVFLDPGVKEAIDPVGA